MGDFEWYMPQDKLSVHVGINHRLSLIYQQKMIPSLIRLGKKHTRLFWKECGSSFYNPRPGTKPRMGNAVWVPEKNCYCYKSRIFIPMKFNDPNIYGIAVEGVTKPEKPKNKST